MRVQALTRAMVGAVCVVVFARVAIAQGPGGSFGPDVIVGDLQDLKSWGSADEIYAFSVGTTSCNLGDEELQWVATTNQHPVIGQNMYRMRDGVLEQVGQSWLKHGFFALSMDLCTPGECIGTSGSSLGVGCSDPYTAERNGQQSNLGPRSQVNASTGEYPFPFSAPPPEGTIGRRLQVPIADLDSSASDPNLAYFVEGQYVSSDDSAAGNGTNNVSCRAINVFESGSTYTIGLIAGETTHRETSTIELWAEMDSSVDLSVIDIAGDGRVFLANKVLSNGDGSYTYVYAIYNMNSDVAIGAFSFPIPAGLGIADGFHAVHHHSLEPVDGEPFGATYSSDDWTATQGAEMRWETGPFGGDITLANPIRWGTMYNFTITTLAPPTDATATLETWKTQEALPVTVKVPATDFVYPVSAVSCVYDLLGNGTALAWSNGESYDAIEIRRAGALVATLPGDATSHFDSVTSPSGPTEYTVSGVVAGENSTPIACNVIVPEDTLNFLLMATSIDLEYSPVTGSGAASTSITLIEDPDNIGFPNDIAGFSIAMTYDPSLLGVTALQQGADLGDPDFFAAEALLDAGEPTGGVTVGVVMSFTLVTALVASDFTEVVAVDLEANPDTLAGDDVGTTMPFYFENGVHGPLPVDQVVTVGIDSYAPVTIDAVISLLPTGEASLPMVRGDVNGDMAVDVSDAVFGLAYLFQDGDADCPAALDTNDDSQLDVADIVYLLSFLFTEGPDLPIPYPACGFDPTDPGVLLCDSTPCP